MKYIILAAAFLLTSCATYSVKTPDPATVTMKVEHNGDSVLTFWRKINADGTKGQRFSVGGNSTFALFMNMGLKKPTLAHSNSMKGLIIWILMI